MHEMSVAQNIVEIVQQYLPEGDPGGVHSVRIRVGQFSGIVRESLEFCFNVITEGTPLEGAVLDIEDVALMVRCRTCSEVSTPAEGLFICQGCGSSDVHILSGTELQVVSLELKDEDGEGNPS